MDFSWSEMMLVGVVALIVIGPKDLPGMFRELGRITAKLRSMAREFSRAMEQAAKDSGVQDVASDLKKVANPAATGLNAVKSAADKFEKWDPLKKTVIPAGGATPAAAPTATATAAAAVAPSDLPTTPALAATPVAEPATLGPATAALAEQQAARKAVAQEAADKLRKISAPVEAAPAEPAAKAAPKPAKAEPAVEPASEAPVRKPGRTRKKADPASGETL
ncbi:Sec-independent protein translocase protein TatB [Xinfangfangia sp. CPCC 101601]|uniref:Sec-independent protein translocase protein TatB n=1 Tax=Pseudogemmobacter lacusdianii TaxID=3069608 RepID=A0ABU0VY51_9RHOB|nr:Sec-independent protein translocase protein TatB [Xinfangfangia sp. CPCC 101601]MDQ2066644.1 Sec-independent protein translocase protein TatB [Xinfangfangia sp. CPCC 101601]